MTRHRSTHRRDTLVRALSPSGAKQGASMALTLSALFAAGALLSLLTLPLTGYLTPGERLGELAAIGTALAAAGLLWRMRERMPAWAYPPMIALGTVCITVGIWAASGGTWKVDAQLFYVWVALYSAYFLSRSQALAQVGFAGACYVVQMLASDEGNVAARGIVATGVLAATAVVVGLIKAQLDDRMAKQEASERRLEESLSLQRATLESTADGLLVVDREGSIVSFNRRFQRMWHIPKEIMASQDDERAIQFVLDQLADPEQFVRKVGQLYDRPAAESYDLLRFKDGRVFERYSQPQRGQDGTIHGRVWSFRDVTERERSQSRLRELADHDPLTGLLNRRRFEEEVAQKVADAARYSSGGTVLLLDLDNFKYVNDNLGHRTGDAVIRSVGQLLLGRLRETDVLARLGGDEFAVLLPHAGEDAAAGVAEDLLEAIRRHRAVFAGRRLRLTTSVGIAPISASRVQTAEELLVEADVAMYAAKESGRDRATTYAPPTAAPVISEASLSWSDRIRAALAEDRFSLYAQPIVELASGRTSQHELLIRLEGERGEVLPPSAFLPSAERSGLIEEIDEWVTRQAIRLIHRHGQLGRSLRLEVNLSGRTLGSTRLPDAIKAQLAETPIDPSSLIFEVTETAAVVNMDEAREFADALSRLGCRFALDDFGAGFGSFYYLKHLPLQYLKIDGDFIVDLGRNPTDQAVVRAIVELARQLRMATIAEFVGDGTTVDLLREFGVDHIQGYHVGRPAPLDALFTDEPAPAAG